MYVSPVVRRMRDDPLPDESTSLVVRVDDDAASDTARDAVRDAAREHGGSVEGTTRFGTVEVTLPEASVDGLCAALPAAVEAVETAGVTGHAGDAGEDVDPSD
jgi:hypothetical protein